MTVSSVFISQTSGMGTLKNVLSSELVSFSLLLSFLWVLLFYISKLHLSHEGAIEGSNWVGEEMGRGVGGSGSGVGKDRKDGQMTGRMNGNMQLTEVGRKRVSQG